MVYRGVAIFLVTSRALLGIVLREPVVGKKREIKSLILMCSF